MGGEDGGDVGGDVDASDLEFTLCGGVEMGYGYFDGWSGWGARPEVLVKG